MFPRLTTGLANCKSAALNTRTTQYLQHSDDEQIVVAYHTISRLSSAS
jgi:hypothetical protein